MLWFALRQSISSPFTGAWEGSCVPVGLSCSPGSGGNCCYTCDCFLTNSCNNHHTRNGFFEIVCTRYDNKEIIQKGRSDGAADKQRRASQCARVRKPKTPLQVCKRRRGSYLYTSFG